MILLTLVTLMNFKKTPAQVLLLNPLDLKDPFDLEDFDVLYVDTIAGSPTQPVGSNHKT